ncbi:hypothetical protein DFH07DRAFT_858059 [Mycena maculata]|uniref:Uncharacterized protein n=1 Tax=Mycena maculata TaxID=230809 RepID=A0AAD7HI97_9AGAR|nr:hypothetical protein DFH07DRAFT_858059 [Mycena maculata]
MRGCVVVPLIRTRARLLVPGSSRRPVARILVVFLFVAASSLARIAAGRAGRRAVAAPAVATAVLPCSIKVVLVLLIDGALAMATSPAVGVAPAVVIAASGPGLVIARLWAVRRERPVRAVGRMLGHRRSRRIHGQRRVAPLLGREIVLRLRLLFGEADIGLDWCRERLVEDFGGEFRVLGSNIGCVGIRDWGELNRFFVGRYYNTEGAIRVDRRHLIQGL